MIERGMQMNRLILHGCNGKMGQVISDLCAEDESCEIVAGVDEIGKCDRSYPCYAIIEDCMEVADCLIDFSHVSAVDKVLHYCMEKKLPLVLCTTGLSSKQLDRVSEASHQIPILRSANMSLGVNLLTKLVRQAAASLVPAGFDAEIVEKHHNQKKDAPSGTALSLAEAINKELGGAYELVTDRSSKACKREPLEIGISSVRGGNIVGEHDVIFAGVDEVITISHTAHSKAIFGKGALQAAKFLAGKTPGFYTMEDVLS
jgi:4-hydroxy-tetrahydrodipicolinate reductase